MSILFFVLAFTILFYTILFLLKSYGPYVSTHAPLNWEFVSCVSVGFAWQNKVDRFEFCIYLPFLMLSFLWWKKKK